MRGELAEAGLPGPDGLPGGVPLSRRAGLLPSARVSCTSTWPSSVRPPATPTATPTATAATAMRALPAARMGYARPDATYADKVVIITNHLVALSQRPLGHPRVRGGLRRRGRTTSATRRASCPAQRATRRTRRSCSSPSTAANVIDAAGYLYDGFSMQMGSGGASLATARFLRQKMLDQRHPLPVRPGRHHRPDHGHARGGPHRPHPRRAEL